MNLYLISQDVNNDYDTYSDAVVAAESEEAARRTHPSNGPGYEEGGGDGTWAPYQDVKVVLIGYSSDGKPGVICASFHAG